MAGAYDGLRLASHASNTPDKKPKSTPDGVPEDDDENEDGDAASNKKEPKMTDMTISAADLEKAKAEARAEASGRYAAVLSSDLYAGRETVARDMLANEKLSAEEITGLLANVPKVGAQASEDDADAKAKALAAADADIGDLGGDDPTPPNTDAQAAADMKAAMARANELTGF